MIIHGKSFAENKFFTMYNLANKNFVQHFQTYISQFCKREDQGSRSKSPPKNFLGKGYGDNCRISKIPRKTLIICANHLIIIRSQYSEPFDVCLCLVWSGKLDQNAIFVHTART